MDGEIHEEFELNEVVDNLHGSVGSRLALVSKEFGFGRGKWDSSSALKIPKDCYRSFVIHPNGRLYRVWVNIIFLWSIYSTFFTPLEFGFFRGLPGWLQDLDCMQFVFLADVVLRFFVAYKDLHTYKMVYDGRSIALRYMKGSFAVDMLGCFPWDTIYKATGRREAIRYLIWIRLFRVKKIIQFFKEMEKDIRINYLFTRIVKLITVELYCTHTAACIFYYLATTLPPAQEGYTWIGSLSLGDYNYINFREIDFWRRYITSLYFAIVTMATVGCKHYMLAEQNKNLKSSPHEPSLLMALMYYNLSSMSRTDNLPSLSRPKRLLRMEKQSLSSILQLYFKDSRQILNNLLEGKETDLRIKQLESDITYLIAKQEAELALGVNNAAYHGDLHHLKGLINAGADPSKTDYDGRTALHMASCKGYEEIVKFLIQRGANVNSIDKFGNSPLLDAVKAGNGRIAAILVENGAILNLEDAGSYLCKVVTDSKIDFLRGLLEYGVDPNSTNYVQRTPLHVAASEGLHLVAKLLIEFGADVLSEDRYSPIVVNYKTN
ncbi:hypothetical protein COCNU_scaffold011279G000020 [Cocos nucifera]|nr:hypothetical protein [Cocos nucifera]